MEEQKISYQTARLANLKGFDPEVKLKKNSHYSNLTEELDPLGVSGAVVVNHYYAATQSLLQKWLREVYKINVESNYLPNIQKYGCLYIPMIGKAKKSDLKFVHKTYYDTYEEALEVGLQEALKLISYVN